MKDRRIYALGFFDGVHRGHQALLAAAVDLAKAEKAEAWVVTFDTHPQNLVQGTAPLLINTAQDRRRLLESYGMAGVQTLRFDETTKNMPWQDFFSYLTADLKACGLVCGDDFRFGKGGQGNATLLQQACKEKGIPCVVVPEQTVNGVRISSTHIRGLMEAGQMAEAVEFLGHPHILTGTVISGRKLGRTIGIPTANLQLPAGLVVPKLGVYACTAHVGKHSYVAVTNVGMRPTVGGHHITVEPWLLDFEGDLYGKELTLQFHAFLRPERKFDTLEDLKAEIQKNAAEAYKLLK